jgi:hypothetical protein
MKIRFVAGLVLSGLVAVPGFAADMPAKTRMAVKAPPPVTTAPEWYAVLSGVAMTRSRPAGTPILSTQTAPGSGNLFRSDALSFGWQGGFEGRAGVKFANRFGAEVGGFFLGDLNTTRTIFNNGGAIQAQVETNPITTYGFSANSRIDYPYTSRIWSVEGNGTWEATPAVILLAGVRYISLRETFSQNLNVPAAAFIENDVWNANNSLLGGQVGTRVDFVRLAGAANSPWIATGDLRAGIFNNQLSNDFVSSFSPPPTVVSRFTGGGSTTSYAVQGGVDVGYRVTEFAKVTLGYQFLYIDRVGLAPNQVGVTGEFGGGFATGTIGARFDDVLYQGVRASLVISR